MNEVTKQYIYYDHLEKEGGGGGGGEGGEGDGRGKRGLNRSRPDNVISLLIITTYF